MMNNYFVSDILHYCNVSLNHCKGMGAKKITYFDLTFVLNGTITYVCDGETYILRKNDAILLPPGTLRSRVAGDTPVKYVSFNFHLLPGIRLPLDKFLPGCISADIRKIVSVFPHRHLTPCYHSTEKAANVLNYILFELLDITSLQSNNEYVLKIVRLIEEHITEKMSLHSISREIGLTKEYVAQIFKRETGKTLTDYLNERKMLLARELILHNEMSHTDLASYLGYDHYNYFSRLFKRYFDMTPSELKREHE